MASLDAASGFMTVLRGERTWEHGDSRNLNNLNSRFLHNLNSISSDIALNLLSFVINTHVCVTLEFLSHLS